MPPTDEQIKDTIEAMEEMVLHSIDPASQYIVVQYGKGTNFVRDRLMAGLPVNMVKHLFHPDKPVHDLGIYRITEEPSRHHDIPAGWATMLIESGIAAQKGGGDITIDDIRGCAMMEVFMRLQAEEEP